MGTKVPGDGLRGLYFQFQYLAEVYAVLKTSRMAIVQVFLVISGCRQGFDWVLQMFYNSFNQIVAHNSFFYFLQFSGITFSNLLNPLLFLFLCLMISHLNFFSNWIDVKKKPSFQSSIQPKPTSSCFSAKYSNSSITRYCCQIFILKFSLQLARNNQQYEGNFFFRNFHMGCFVNPTWKCPSRKFYQYLILTRY